MFSLSQFTLPFARDALEPYISARTIEFHYEKHLGGYINNLNNLITGTEFENMPLADIIKNSSGKLFNNAAQVFNHDFFFKCLEKDGNYAPVPGQEKIKSDIRAAATPFFGSGWVWLLSDGTVITTANADTPVAHRQTPALALDLWEHAYYLDYQNRRADFVDIFLEHLVNWDIVSKGLNS